MTRWDAFMETLAAKFPGDATPATDIGLVLKADDERMIAYGWASVITEGGRTVTDLQGDEIEEDDLLDAVHKFMSDHRAGMVLHAGGIVAEIIESIIFTEALQKSLGIALGKTGWFIGMKIRDEAVWKRVKNGELRMFSVGGRGVRVDA